MPLPLSLTIAHRLPGRLRVRLSHSLNDPEVLISYVRHHDGVLGIEYTPVTGSVLLTSDPCRVTQEEIMLRVALAMALDHGAEPVRVYSDPSAPHLAPSAVISGLILLGAAVARFGGGRKIPPGMDIAAGLGTVWAAVDHAWGEIRQRGNFDPEVVSLFLLIAAMLRGNTLPAALLTWFSTFGRHLIEPPRSAVEVRPVQLSARPDGPRYEIAVSPVQAEPRGVPLLRVVPSLLMYAATGGRGRLGTRLIEEMREVSRVHDRVLESLSTTAGGFPLYVR